MGWERVDQRNDVVYVELRGFFSVSPSIAISPQRKMIVESFLASNKPTERRAKGSTPLCPRRGGSIVRPSVFLSLFFLVVLAGAVLYVSFWAGSTGPAGNHAQQVAGGVDPQDASAASDLESQGTASSVELDDPSRDGWQTEVFADVAKHRMSDLIKLLSEPSQILAAECQQFVAKDFQGDSVLPENLEVVYQDPKIRIERFEHAEQGRKAPQDQSLEAQVQGIEEFVAAVNRWAAPFQGTENLRFEVKIVGIYLDGERATTTQKIALTARTESGRIEQHATWVADWLLESDTQQPKLTGLQVKNFEQTTLSHDKGELLADCTVSVLGGNPCYEPQILQGYSSQLERIQDWRYCVLLSTPGMAVGDVNGDGLEDLYVCQETGLPNLLFVQQSDGTAKNLAREWGVDWLHTSPAALLVDLDNDGDQDLAVAVAGGIIIASNEGGRFADRGFLPTADDTRSLTASDFDLDGRLDLFICVYGPNGSITNREDSAVPGISYRGSLYHDATSGGANSLFRNQGDWQFQDVTDEVGLEPSNHRLSLAASWEDYDQDGDMDLYVANDYGPNNLYRNDPATSAGTSGSTARQFTDIAEAVGAGDHANGMSVSWGDHDRDGWMDLYVGNMFSSAGNRITTQAAFKSDASEEVRSTLKRFARGNTLMKNRGDGTFEDMSEQADVTMGRWAWSSPFVDINNDGWEDLLVTNGFITGKDTRDL
jgi:hypothetical protein